MVTSLIFALTMSTQTVPVTFAGGYETEGRDRGRPVILIAAGLGVPAPVFREAFSHVHPAPAGSQPQPDDVRKNKEALLTALGKYGVTNERLDNVSNYYRYNRSRGEWWPTQPASATATIVDGKVVSFRVLSGGAGYSSLPVATFPGMGSVHVVVTLAYGKDLAKNGAVTGLALAK